MVRKTLDDTYFPNRRLGFDSVSQTLIAIRLQIKSRNRNPPRIRPQKSITHPQRRCFSRSIRPEEADDLAALLDALPALLQTDAEAS